MKVFYMIPRDGLGGVEYAARTIEKQISPDFYLCFMVGKSEANRNFYKYICKDGKFDSLKMYFDVLKFLLRERPDVMICSLWRSTAMGMIYFLWSLLFRWKKIKFIVFVHSSRYSNFLDKWVNFFAYRMADEIWCDSAASRERFDKTNMKNKSKIISFFIRNEQKAFSTPESCNFAYWGRISHEKNVLKAINIFLEIKKYIPNANYYIYGPPADAYEEVLTLLDELGVDSGIHLMGLKAPGFYPVEVASCRFYLSMSLREGKAIAVIEAMQLGLVPVVSMVGEIKNYCKDGENCIAFKGEVRDVALQVKSVLENGRYRDLRAAAESTWIGEVDFSSDVTHHINKLRK